VGLSGEMMLKWMMLKWGLWLFWSLLAWWLGPWPLPEQVRCPRGSLAGGGAWDPKDESEGNIELRSEYVLFIVLTLKVFLVSGV